MTVSYEEELRYKDLVGWYLFFLFILCSTLQIEVKFQKYIICAFYSLAISVSSY